MSDEQEQPILTPARDTLTVVQTVYHQPAGEEPTAVTLQYVRPLEFQEQPYARKIKVGESWQPLDLGWIEQPGMVLIVNDEGKFSQTNPTDDERAEAAAKIVAVGWSCEGGIGPAEWLIHPQAFFYAEPTDAGRVYLRCRNGTARVTIHIYPR